MGFMTAKASGETTKDGQTRSVLDGYSNKVFRLVVLIVPIFFLCGNGTMTTLYYLGMYPAVNGVAMWCSNAVDILYMLIAIYLVRTSYGPDGLLIPKNLPIAKLVLLVMVVVQWNLNSYVCPFTDFWAYAPLFVIVHAFFFDVKYVRLSTVLILVSMVISWIVNGENLLPVRNEFFTLNIVFRVIALSFTLLCINIITWFGKVFIIEVVSARDKEREMREKSDEYEREARMKSDFLANMSHEIRTPMNAVIGMAEIAMREDLPASTVDCLTQIQKSGRNLLNIINDILDYSKIDSGKMEIMPERYEPASELNDIANILTTRIGDKKLELYIVTDTEVPHALFGDAMRIRQILINLANNAIKFTNEGSVSVIISCERADNDMALITFHIKDTGIGISKEDMDKLFVSFQQVDSRRNRSVEGTGLGLAISQRLVEAMGGRIGVDSVYGEGSDFWFSIPQKILDSTIVFYVEKPEKKRAVIMGMDSGRSLYFMEELERLGVSRVAIDGPDAYKPSSGKADYLFFDYGDYDEAVQKLLEQNSDLTGAVIIDYNSTFKSELDNLLTIRRPISTNQIVRVLNGEDETEQIYEEEAYTINFTAPDAKILIVDDNEINITIAEGLLAPMKMKIDSALSGPEAIEKIKREKYDIVLMDHMMPVMDGVDATKIIRDGIASEKELVIIALSANALKEARDMFLESGMNDFVAKPIEIKELVAKIRKWLPEKKVIKGAVKKQESSEGLDPLADFYMLEARQAVKALGSPELYRTIVGEYYKAGQENYEAIRKAYKAEDMKDFTIRVHALKSSSRQIGALELGDRAEALERAGKSDDLYFVRTNSEDMLNLYRDILDSLAPIFPEEESDTEELPMIPNDLLKELLEKLTLACEDFDTDRLEEARDELGEYSWPSEIQDDIVELCEAIDRMEVVTCEDILERIKNE